MSWYVLCSIRNISKHLSRATSTRSVFRNSEAFCIRDLRMGSARASEMALCESCLFSKSMWLLKSAKDKQTNKKINKIKKWFLHMWHHQNNKTTHREPVSNGGRSFLTVMTHWETGPLWWRMVTAMAAEANRCCGQTSCLSKVQQPVSSALCSLPETHTNPQWVNIISGWILYNNQI